MVVFSCMVGDQMIVTFWCSFGHSLLILSFRRYGAVLCHKILVYKRQDFQLLYGKDLIWIIDKIDGRLRSTRFVIMLYNPFVT